MAVGTTINVKIIKEILNSLARQQGYKNLYEVCNMSNPGKNFLISLYKLEEENKLFSTEEALEKIKEFSNLFFINDVNKLTNAEVNLLQDYLVIQNLQYD